MPDQFGISFYVAGSPPPDGTDDMLQWFKDLTTGLKTRHGRPSFIAEGGMPSEAMRTPFPYGESVKGYPFSEQGQFAQNRDMIACGQTSGALAGYRPWAPDLAVPGWQPMSWFDPKGDIAYAKPALQCFEAALPSLFVAVVPARATPPALSVRTGGHPVDCPRSASKTHQALPLTPPISPQTSAGAKSGGRERRMPMPRIAGTLTINHQGRRIAERSLLPSLNSPT